MTVLRIQTPEWALPLLEPCRYKGAYGGRGGGKSQFMAEMVVEEHIMNPERRTVCVREIQKSLGQSVKRLIEDKIGALNAGDYFEILDTQIRSKRGGGLIIFQGMQNHTADSIKSLEGYDCAWVEEAQTLSQYSLDLLRPTIRKPNSELWFTWNPRFKTDAVDKFFRGEKRQDMIVVNVNWNDNPWFDETPLRGDMEADYQADPDRAEHVWGGQYGASIGAILAKWVNRAEREGRIHDGVKYDSNGDTMGVSADLGFRDTASFWYWQAVPGGFNVLKYDADTGLDADEWIPRIQDNIRELGGKKAKIWLPHDARARTFQSRHTTLEKFLQAFGAGTCEIVPQSKKQDQIEAARTIINRCAFNKELCEVGLDGLRAWEFAYNEETGIMSREPVHNWASHPADAFCYGAQKIAEKTQDLAKKVDIFPAKGQNGRIITAPLDTLWTETRPLSSRI